MNLRQLKIRPRLLLCFAAMLLMAALLAGIGGFGLNVAQKALNGITRELIPANNITVSARTRLLESSAATATLVASIYDSDGMKRAKADWDRAQKGLDKAMDDYGAIAKEPQSADKLTEFRSHIAKYRAAVAPVATKILDNGYGSAQDAFADIKIADASYNPALVMLQGIEAKLTTSSETVFTKVDGLVTTLFSALVMAFVACCVIGVLLAVRLSRSIVAPLRQASHLATRIADGDLRATDAVDAGADEAAEMMRSLSTMQASLVQIVGQVRESAESIEVASAEVASGNLDLSNRTEQTAGNLQQTASSMSQLSGTVSQSAEAAGQAKSLAGTAANAAGRGGEVVSRVVTTMDEINTSSKRIADIIATIDGIAFQTNILALNAAVEAARAGEQGRGFAVVAGEVRLLAQRSAEAAREIKVLIATSVDRVSTGTQLVGAAGTTMTEIVASVQRVADIIGEIAASASEQSSGLSDVNGSVVELDQMTQQNAALVEESAAAAQSLKDQATRLSGLMSRFRLA
ncbi:methyl-accepting chemotaxis protein [soil metagenome]